MTGYACNLKEVDPPISPTTKTFEIKSFPVSSIDDVGEYVFENSDGNFVIVGSSFGTWDAGDGNGIVLTLDTNGHMISPTRYNLGGPKFTYCMDGLELPSNKQYMLTGMKLDESVNKRQTFLDRLDGSGMDVTGFPKPMQTPNNSWGKKSSIQKMIKL